MRLKEGLYMNNKFCEVLKKLRISRGVTQSELAKVLGVSPSTVGMYENGQREPNFEIEEKIADYFNVTLDYLRGKTEKNTSDDAKTAVDMMLNGKIASLNQKNQGLLMSYYQALLDTQNEDLKDRLKDI